MQLFKKTGWGALVMLGMATAGCTSAPKPSLAQTEATPAEAKPALYSEKYRPQFHFSPREGWIGDPDGLIHYGGYYHMFWWGHAISKDLVHWTELPWPMLGDDGSFKYYTGSVVVDKENTANFGKNSMVAVFTQHLNEGDMENVGLASSQNYTDFHWFKGNPVLDVKSKDFRDPQVLWHAPTKRWIMAITLPSARKISFYASPDLKKWEHLSDFGGLGAQGNSWEVPDLFELPVDGDANNKKWVLTVGVSPNRTQYFTGDFDGTRFTPDAATKKFLGESGGADEAVFAAFDGADYGDWKTTGTAFGNGPSRGGLPHLGAGYVDSFGGSDAATGTLTSPNFTIEKPAINFLIAGGNHPEKTAINLLIDGKVVRTATGDGSGALKQRGWGVGDLKGKSAQIQIVDSYSGDDFGHLMADQITFADEVRDDGSERALWADWGGDFYAARSWRDEDKTQNRTVWGAWMGNWDYANDVPSSWGRGFQSLPRELELQTRPEGIRLIQKPIPALEKLRQKPVQGVAAFKPSRNTYEIEAQFDVTKPDAKFGLNLLVGDGRKLVLGYDAAKKQLTLDRTQTSDFKSNENFNKNFPKVMTAPLIAREGAIDLRIFVDQSSVEVWADSGQVALSALTFPGEGQTGIETFGTGGALKSFTGWELNSIWNPDIKPIPGVIEAEDFDKGGPNVGFKDADAANQGGAYRPDEGVDIEPLEDAEGFNVAWMAPNEWLGYTIKSDYNDEYLVSARMSGRGGTFHFEIDGKDISGPLKAPSTGDFRKWSQVVAPVKIPFGTHQLRFVVDGGSFNLDRLKITTKGNQIVAGATYQLAARHSGRVLDATGTGDGAAVRQWENLGGANQKWKIENAGDGYYKIVAQNGGKVLDINGFEDGAPAQLWPDKGGDNQKWDIQEIGGGYFVIYHKDSEQVLEIDGFSKINGGKVQGWKYLGGASQVWKLTRVDGGAR